MDSDSFDQILTAMVVHRNRSYCSNRSNCSSSRFAIAAFTIQFQVAKTVKSYLVSDMHLTRILEAYTLNYLVCSLDCYAKAGLYSLIRIVMKVINFGDRH